VRVFLFKKSFFVHFFYHLFVLFFKSAFSFKRGKGGMGFNIYYFHFFMGCKSVFLL